VVVVGSGSSSGYDTVETTETAFERTLATYTKPLVGLTAIGRGNWSTGIVAITEYFCALAVPISEENTIVDISNVIVKVKTI